MDQCTHEVRAEYWKKIIQACGQRPAGQSAKSWMDENGISEQSYYHWQRRFRKQAYEEMKGNSSVPAVTEKTELSGYSSLKSEVKYGAERSRIDFMLQADSRPDCYIEVKSVTLAENEQGYFPDAVTERGQKHLRELMSVAAEGQRAVIFFAVLHSAITRFSPARHIDEKYAQLLSEAQQRGVEILAYKAEISAEGMALKKSLPVTL